MVKEIYYYIYNDLFYSFFVKSKLYLNKLFIVY